jgi:hypothetical protein
VRFSSTTRYLLVDNVTSVPVMSVPSVRLK